MKKLIETFNELPLPETNESEFSAMPININSNHRIAKTKTGQPCILLYVGDNKKTEHFAHTQLKNIRVWFDIECNIRIGRKQECKTFTVINFTGDDESLYYSFLRVAELLIDELGENPTKEDVSKIVNAFIRLFKNISDFPKKSIQGLWAELFLISISYDVKRMAKAWHLNIEDKHDFNSDIDRIEVKSSSTRKREHHFSLNQLIRIDKTNIYIASLFVERSEYGKSMEDLVEEIKGKLKNEFELLEKIYLICYKTLGNSLDMSFRMKFDYKLATDSLKFYDINSIPKIKKEDLPKGIIDVKLLINLDQIKYLGKKDIPSLIGI